MNTNIHPYIDHIFNLYNISQHLSFSDSGFFFVQAHHCSHEITHIDYGQIASVMEYGSSVVFILLNQDKIVFSKDGADAPIYLPYECESDFFLSQRCRLKRRFKKRVHAFFERIKKR